MTKSKITARLMLMTIAMLAVITVFSAINVPTINTVYAENSLEDSVDGETAEGSVSDSGSSGSGSDAGEDLLGDIRDQEIDPEDQGVSDWLKGQNGVTSDQLEAASRTMSPITTVIGYITGGIIILTVVAVTLITALDLLYIAIPPVRNLMYKAGTDGTGGYTGGFGAGGFGRGMGGMASMGAGGASGGSAKPTQWVSDEAVACAAMLGGSAQSGNNAMGGMGFGMGGQQRQQQSTKSVIGMYFRKRLFFMLLLAICIIVLTSSTIMDCGINLAEWVLKIITVLNGKLE